MIFSYLKDSFFLIAGPCVLEDEEKGAGFSLEIAKEIFKVGKKLGIPVIFKASYDKANRTSHRSFRGPGLEKGLQILQEIKDKLSLPILTDVHQVDEVGPASKVADILQIPAFLCRQTDLLQEAGRKARGVNVKKGQFLAPWDMKGVVEKLEAVGQKNILLTDRGTSFGYNNLVSDMRAIPIMKGFGYPVVYDATHSVQLPGGMGDRTGGMAEMIPFLSRAAVGAGCDGLFMEVHPEPQKALSDGPNSFPLQELEDFLSHLYKIYQVVHSCS